MGTGEEDWIFFRVLGVWTWDLGDGGKRLQFDLEFWIRIVNATM